MLKKIGNELFAGLSSVKLAVFTLASLAAVLAVGTILESLHDAETASHYVYGTFWFSALLFLLGLNVFFAALSRWPWKRHHIGFLITHLGILTILTGAFFTLWKAYEGQVVFSEGETARRITLQEPQLFFFDGAQGKLETIPVNFRFDPPSQETPFYGKALGDVLVKVTDYLPNARLEIDVREDPQGEENPALKVQIKGSRATVEEWLFSRDFERQRLSLGPAHLSFVEVPELKALKGLLGKPEAFVGPLLWFQGKWIPVLSNLKNEIPLKSGNLILDDFFSHAVISPEGVGNLSTQLENPAVRYRWLSGGKEIKGLAFSKYPGFDTPSHSEHPFTGPKLYLFPKEWGGEKNELLLARLSNGNLYYSIKKSVGWSEPVALPNEGISPGWMDFKLQVLEKKSFAQIVKNYRKVSVPKGQKQEGPPPAIHLTLAQGGISKDFWLGRGESQDVTLGGRQIKLAYGLKSLPLGFELTLNDFKMALNEGTQDPASFESEVTLMDPATLQKSQHQIVMNQPLKYGPYKLFQASYQAGGPGQPDISVLAAAYDPGVPVKYVGSLVMVSGIITMFFLKPLFVQKRLAAKRRVSSNSDLKGNTPAPVLKINEDMAS